MYFLKFKLNTNNKKKLLNSFLFLFLLGQMFVIPSALAGIIFEDNFDGREDWSSNTSYNAVSVWPATIQTILGGPASSSNLPAWYNYRCGSSSNTTGEPLYVVDSTDPHGGTGKSLRYNLENASYMNGGSINAVLCNSGTCGYDTLSMRFYMKLEPDFDFANGGSDFIKLFRLFTGVDVVNDTMGPSSTYATNDDYNSSPQIKRSSLIIVYVVIDGNGDYRLSYEYEHGQQVGVDWEYEQKYLPEATWNFKDYLGQWVYFEMQATLNTVGQSDGEIKIWIMPESGISSYDVNNPTVTWSNLLIRDTNDRKWNALILADNMSGQWERAVDEQTLTYDDLVISTDPIGPVNINTESFINIESIIFSGQ